mmetsp:Transcript_2329/g.5165  ORF Transcript_2329/g.5165 Transcript_2329/m.5165 type:complete len:332 (-) Transcript_2329:147-1142(-)
MQANIEPLEKKDSESQNQRVHTEADSVLRVCPNCACWREFNTIQSLGGTLSCRACYWQLSWTAVPQVPFNKKVEHALADGRAFSDLATTRSVWENDFSEHVVREDDRRRRAAERARGAVPGTTFTIEDNDYSPRWTSWSTNGHLRRNPEVFPPVAPWRPRVDDSPPILLGRITNPRKVQLPPVSQHGAPTRRKTLKNFVEQNKALAGKASIRSPLTAAFVAAKFASSASEPTLGTARRSLATLGRSVDGSEDGEQTADPPTAQTRALNAFANILAAKRNDAALRLPNLPTRTFAAREAAPASPDDAGVSAAAPPDKTSVRFPTQTREVKSR